MGIEHEDGTINYSVSFTHVSEDAVGLLNIVFNDKNKIVGTYELDMNKLSEVKSSVKYWINDQIIVNQDFDISEYTENSTNNEGEYSTMGWTDCMNDCLSGKGLTMWAIALLAILCGASCTVGVPATAGTACYACVNTAGIIGVNAFFDCMEKCR